MLNDGWIVWYGGDCPVPSNFRVEIKNKTGILAGAGKASDFNWQHKDRFDDIISYRVIGELNVDPVNHPSHYTAGKVECIDALESATVNLTGIEAVCTANAIKYLWRWKQKNGVEDLRKARWYIQKLIDSKDESC